MYLSILPSIHPIHPSIHPFFLQHCLAYSRHIKHLCRINFSKWLLTRSWNDQHPSSNFGLLWDPVSYWPVQVGGERQPNGLHHWQGSTVERSWVLPSFPTSLFVDFKPILLTNMSKREGIGTFFFPKGSQTSGTMWAEKYLHLKVLVCFTFLGLDV